VSLNAGLSIGDDSDDDNESSLSSSTILGPLLLLTFSSEDSLLLTVAASEKREVVIGGDDFKKDNRSDDPLCGPSVWKGEIIKGCLVILWRGMVNDKQLVEQLTTTTNKHTMVARLGDDGDDLRNAVAVVDDSHFFPSALRHRLPACRRGRSVDGHDEDVDKLAATMLFDI